MNIVFFGTSEFGAIILEKLVQAKMTPVLAVTTPDMPSGRKQTPTPSPVKVMAKKLGIPLFQPEKIQAFAPSSGLRLRGSDSRSRGDTIYKIQDTKPDLIVLAAYGRIIPKEILDIPAHGALNVHPSLLPKYRGPSPIQSAILEGDKETGVTILLMDEEIDHGPIVANSKFEIRNSKFIYPELHNKLAELGGDLLIQTIPEWIAGKIKPVPQDHSRATYIKRIKKEDGKVDWNKSAEYIERQVRAFSPWPGAFTFWKGKRVKILKAHVEQGKLIIDELQLEGKKPTTLQEFLLGHKDFTVS